MIRGIGIDIIENNRIKKSIDKFGNLFLEKIFSSQEIEYCQKKFDSFSSFAVRFACKEAFLKALGTGIRGNLLLKDIYVINDEFGKPYVFINDKIKVIFNKHNISKCHISLSHSKEFSVAQVILEG